MLCKLTLEIWPNGRNAVRFSKDIELTIDDNTETVQSNELCYHLNKIRREMMHELAELGLAEHSK